MGHFSLCHRDIKTQNEDYAEIGTEVDNYKNFRLALTNYLYTYPMIPNNEFKKQGLKLYDKMQCNFSLKKYNFKNIYSL